MTGESLARLLGMEGWKIKGEPFFVEGSGRPFAMVEIVREKRVYQCGCGRRFTTYYDGEEREVRDLSWGKWDFSLFFFQVRVDCPECGVKTEQLDWLVPGSRYTKRFAAYVAQLCRLATVSAVAKHLGLDWKTVKRFDKSALEEELDPPDLEELRVLAVDEIAIKKGHKYATVMIDFETRRVVWAMEDRTEEALGSFYEMLGKDRCGLIEAVAMDMWKPYENATRDYCRNAEIVYDKFHILSHFSKVIDQVRNAEFKRAEEQDKAVLKGTKYLLLRNWDNLEHEQKDRLVELLDLNENLNIVYILKEELKQLWIYKYPGAAWNFFLKWLQTALDSNIEPLIQLGTMLYNHWEGIAAHCRYPIHTSVLEGMNNTAKVIKRMAYGFRDTAYFFLKLRSTFPGKEALAYES
jgi:transposase